jgi:hypothetical protein
MVLVFCWYTTILSVLFFGLETFPIKHICVWMSSDDYITELHSPSSQEVTSEERQTKRARNNNETDDIPNSISCGASCSDKVDQLQLLPSQLYRAKLLKEKQFVNLIKRTGQNKGFTSPVWRYDYFRIAKLIYGWEEQQIGTIIYLIFILCYISNIL